MKIFWTALKYFGIVSATIGSLYVAFTYFDDMKDKITDVQETVNYISIDQAEAAEEIAKIQDTLVRFEIEHRKQSEDIKTITWGLKNQKNFTSEQFDNIMDELLKKNNSYPDWTVIIENTP